VIANLVLAAALLSLPQRSAAAGVVSIYFDASLDTTTVQVRAINDNTTQAWAANYAADTVCGLCSNHKHCVIDMFNVSPSSKLQQWFTVAVNGTGNYTSEPRLTCEPTVPAPTGGGCPCWMYKTGGNGSCP